MMDASEQETNYLRYVKVALASVIIRKKPANSTAKEYTETLMKMLKDKDVETDKKIKDLTTELIHTKQDLVKTQLESQVNEQRENTECQNMTSEIDNSMLTPPLSSENSCTEIQGEKILQRHSQFLRQISFLCQNNTTCVNKDYGSVVMETLQNVIQLMEKGETLIMLPDKVLQSCIAGITDIIKSPSTTEHQTLLKAQVLNLVKHLVKEMSGCSTIQFSQKISKLLVSLGSCQVLCNDVLCCLTSHVCAFSSQLHDVIDGRVTLRCKMLEYDNIYLVMWTIEQIFTNSLRKSPCPQEVKEHLTTLMEDSVVHISRSFPVFASYIWRLQALIIE